MSVYDDEIDLRPYILTLIRNWWLIALLFLIAAGSAFVYSQLQPRTYEATATILLTRTRSALSLAQQFPTINEPVDSPARMNALLTITESDALAYETLQSIADKLPPEERELEDIKDRVRVEAKGDAILVRGAARDPLLAAEIANTWAGRAVTAINQAYSSEQPLTEIQNQLVSAQNEYEIAQADLERFVQDNEIQVLIKKIDEAQALFNNLAAERALRISYYSNRKLAMEELAVQAEALRRQLQGDNRSLAGDIGDALAVLHTRASALGIRIGENAFQNLQTVDQRIGTSGEAGTGTQASTIGLIAPSPRAAASDPGFTINLQIGEVGSLVDSAANYVADLDALITLATEERSRAEATLDGIVAEIFQDGGNPNLEAIAAQLRDLETRLQREQARQLELASKRDLAWRAYQAIAQKETEIKNAAQTSNQVNLASQAVPPQKPAGRGTLRNTLVAGALGLMAGIFWVFGAQWWRSSDQFSTGSSPALATDPADK